MTLDELIDGFRNRCTGLTESEKIKALASDYRAAGFQNGLALQEAFDVWRVNWEQQRAPRPASPMVRSAQTMRSATRRSRL